ncbi:MAG: polysaccharide deacetylase family protein [Eubacteriales bacterium]|nr:polysaccharide deacetylase family protein [Eubacteriales bacterium]
MSSGSNLSTTPDSKINSRPKKRRQRDFSVLIPFAIIGAGIILVILIVVFAFRSCSAAAASADPSAANADAAAAASPDRALAAGGEDGGNTAAGADGVAGADGGEAGDATGAGDNAAAATNLAGAATDSTTDTAATDSTDTATAAAAEAAAMLSYDDISRILTSGGTLTGSISDAGLCADINKYDQTAYSGTAIAIDGVYARSGPTINDTKYGKIQVGQTYEIIETAGEDGNWYKFNYNGREAYVHSKYLFPLKYEALHNAFLSLEPDMTGVDPSKPMIALTFDDGPNEAYTNRILDTLAAYGAKATFFIIGANVVDPNNECVQREVDEGHELANHTYDHDRFTKNTPEDMLRSLRKADYRIEKTVGRAAMLVRPPGGAFDDAGGTVLTNYGAPAILWSIDSLDWDNKDPNVVYSNVMTDIKDGDIVLLHDIHKQTADAVERIVPDLVAQGYQLVTVSQLAKARGKAMEPGGVYRSFYPD